MFETLENLTTQLVDLRNDEKFDLKKYKSVKETRKILQLIKVECQLLRSKVSESFKESNKKV